ncbi:hypothetical protein [Cytobacillus purgationiresistens]|uniref:L-amino acid N-acyltransferase YncA n=1 Tax=Cytobacillus purgationiresistens TaxID=863449 RepID=A0ABU0AMV9_9BACI|nr:hypothetical protein [Cytobacillus purgationiresistens]MDQ0271385.1 L-amino acid N-acyltransferase YncA [Cytobacillus purgationiresistens]
MVKEDWEQVSQIYMDGIATWNVTFEAAAPTWQVWNQVCRLVARSGPEILG